MILPADADPEEILKNQPEKIAYAMGASSGESGAKAATKGAAKIRTANHGATVKAILEGKAAAGFVKSWWWRANKDKYPTLKAYQLPGISDEKNPDNVLTASNGLSAEVRDKIKQAAIESADAFGVEKMVEFNSDDVNFSLGLMKKGQIDPKTYSW